MSDQSDNESDNDSPDCEFPNSGYSNDPVYPPGEMPSEVNDSSAVLAEYQRRLMNKNNWCTCENCHIMDTGKECVCCREMAVLQEKMDTPVTLDAVVEEATTEAVAPEAVTVADELVAAESVTLDPEPGSRYTESWTSMYEHTDTPKVGLQCICTHPEFAQVCLNIFISALPTLIGVHTEKSMGK